MRVGIGRPPGRQDPADFVLKDFSATERKELELLRRRGRRRRRAAAGAGPRGRAERGPPPQLTVAGLLARPAVTGRLSRNGEAGSARP